MKSSELGIGYETRWAGRQAARQTTAKRPLWLVKLLNYEYWNWWVFYLPLLPYYLWLAWRARSFTFFTAVNPGIEAGGFFGESKIGILDQLPGAYKPFSVFFAQNASFAQVLQQLENQGLRFPVVCKPDVGERGTRVEKLNDEAALRDYLANHTGALIVQEYVGFACELGVMFHRMPGDAAGRVTSITAKEFLSVTGDGRSTLAQLMQQSDRARFQLRRMRQRLGDAAMNEVPPAGEKRLLEPIGNHCRGTLFRNANHLIDDRLHEVFSRIALGFKGFDYGRFDLKVSSLEDLYAGRNIRIMELNGVSAEPAHIYDPAYTLRAAYRDLTRHLDLIYRTSRANRRRGVRPVPARLLLQQVWRHFRRKI